MHSPETCGHSKKSALSTTFCDLLMGSKGIPAPCAAIQGRIDDCPLENTMQSGDSSVIQQGDTERD